MFVLAIVTVGISGVTVSGALGPTAHVVSAVVMVHRSDSHHFSIRSINCIGRSPQTPACRELRYLRQAKPFPSPKVRCLQIWGGPAYAVVTYGLGDDRIVTRSNSCEIHVWDRSKALLGSPH
jgi:hypothetical protein